MSVEMIARTRPRVVIVGGGFAGAYCARELDRQLRGTDADILLLDPNNYFIFHPLLVEAGVGSLEPRHVVVGIRTYISRRVRFRMAAVESVDFASQTVHYRMAGTQRIRRAPYDHIVFAAGSVTLMPPIPGLKEHAFEVKDVGDAVGLRDHAIRMLELANVETSAEKKRALLSFVVVGGSFTGVEVAGEFNEFLRRATAQYRNLKPSDCRVALVERGARILPPLSPSLATYAQRRMEELGVRVLLGRSLKEARPASVLLDDDTKIPARTLVWCAGIAQNALAKRLGLPKDERGYILCERDLRVKGSNTIWAIGDTARIPGPDGKPYPATAQHAVRQGAHAARNIARSLSGRTPRPCVLRNLGALCPIGYRKAVAEIFGLRFSGWIAWWMWRTVYLMKMPTWSRRARVAADWTMDLLFSRDTTQLGIHRPVPQHGRH